MYSSITVTDPYSNYMLNSTGRTNPTHSLLCLHPESFDFCCTFAVSTGVFRAVRPTNGTRASRAMNVACNLLPILFSNLWMTCPPLHLLHDCEYGWLYMANLDALKYCVRFLPSSHTPTQPNRGGLLPHV